MKKKKFEREIATTYYYSDGRLDKLTEFINKINVAYPDCLVEMFEDTVLEEGKPADVIGFKIYKVYEETDEEFDKRVIETEKSEELVLKSEYNKAIKILKNSKEKSFFDIEYIKKILNMKIENIKLTKKKKRHYELISVGESYWILQSDDDQFSIEDYHPSGDYKGPMKFKKKDAVKLQRFLNHYYKGNNSMFDFQIYNRIKKHLDLKTGVYAKY